MMVNPVLHAKFPFLEFMNNEMKYENMTFSPMIGRYIYRSAMIALLGRNSR